MREIGENTSEKTNEISQVYLQTVFIASLFYLLNDYFILNYCIVKFR